MGQTFKNYYEETKYYAELEVEKLKKQLPITIIRPGIVVGHSETGETSKFDGPYFILNFFTKLRYLPIPKLGKENANCNFIPVDYLINAVYYLSHSEIGVNKTYQITDPSPYPIQDIYRDILSYYLNKTTVGIIPLKFISPLLSIPFIRRLLKVEKEVLSYFNCKSEYDCTNTLSDLQYTGIKCPDFKEVLPVITNYYKAHKTVLEKHVLIK
ncbi:SDR family oxidoreductase [Gottfriedia acidiceleris]|uniref:SDR family oxidoreductase n=1 Tax=Gottfriedia acidiceleris TaxID=371036 RepID=UPI0030003A02